MSWERVRPNATTLRGLAHPLRVKMINLLRADGPSTATLLAQRLGQSTGVTSYHLRQLAQHGFVVEDPERGAGRERWWKAAHQGTLLEEEVARAAPGDAETYMRAVAAMYADRVDHFLSELPSMPAQWGSSATLSDIRLRLTPDEGRDLFQAINELIGRYRRDDPETPAPPDAERVTVQWQIMPFVRTTDLPDDTADGPA